MSNRVLTEQFAAWRDAGEELVLVTVVETAGSTYSKAGRQLLINRAHDYIGLVGGGCLEGDLVLRADEVFADGSPQLVTYDMRDDADDLWGMGLGCRGMMRLLLQKLDRDNDWQPFTRLAELMRKPQATAVALALGSRDTPAGELVEPEHNGQSVCWTIEPWTRLLVLGAGPDAGPVIGIAASLGWYIVVADHRADLLQSEYLGAADEIREVQPATLAEDLRLADFNAVCVMSHHLASDRDYLHALAKYQHPYIGVLGPAARRRELLTQLELTDSDFGRRLHGPVGMNIGADSPQSIALALLAEIHACLHGAPANHTVGKHDERTL